MEKENDLSSSNDPKMYIDLSMEERERMAKDFMVSEKMVYYALSYKKDSDLAKRLRKIAIERGGVRMLSVPEIETIHDCRGQMRQYFPNGAMIEIDKKDGRAVVVWHGDVVAELADCYVTDIPELQSLAANVHHIKVLSEGRHKMTLHHKGEWLSGIEQDELSVCE